MSVYPYGKKQQGNAIIPNEGDFMMSFRDVAMAGVFRFSDSDRYAVKTGPHSYVAVQEDGEMVKLSITDDRVQVISAWTEATNEII